MSTVTAIILARNEEKHIVDCIKSIQFADEILVIDDGSTDQTVSLATGLDERVSPELAKSIQRAIQGEPKAYWLRRYNLFHHNQATHGVVRPDKVLRLMPREGATVEGAVHEAFISPYPQDTLEGKLYHYTYDNWHQFFEKFNKYTTAAANKYKEQGKSCSFLGDIILRPTWAFFKIYILQGGILDGKIGFLLSIYHMMYTMTKYVKLYYLNKSNGQL